MKQIWTIKSVLEWTLGHFESKGTQNPRLEAQWIVSAATGLSRIELYTNYDLPLEQEQLGKVRDGIKRRLAGEPLQYIVGKAAFRRLEFMVRTPVLIPRPETEILVDVVLKELERLSQSYEGDSSSSSEPIARVLDIGTGSGCIALSLVHEANLTDVIATDISEEAIALATENAQVLGYGDSPRLSIIQDNLADSLLKEVANHASFDIIVSNPPYIPTSELDELPQEVAEYESHKALDGGEDGLDTFREIVAQAKVLLKPGGMLACELHEDTLGAAKDFCAQQGFVDVNVHEDLTQRPRVVSAFMPR